MRRKLDLQVCNTWEQLPDVWKSVKKVKPIDYKKEISDKNLLKIVGAFFSDDLLRPAMTGAYVEPNCITVTNATMLINLPFQSKVQPDIYRINPKSKSDVKMYDVIKGQKYPPYKDILESVSTTHKISVYKLKTYIQAVINGKYCNSVTNKITFKYDKDTMVSFNGELMTEILDSFLLMSHDELYVTLARSTMYFSPNQETAKKPKENIGKHPFALLMKYANNDEDVFGASDIDFNTEIKVYYCFECDKIFNADNSVADFDINLNSTDLPYMNSEYLKLMSRMIPKVSNIPITEYVKVENTIATCTDLKFLLNVKDVYIENGIYEIVNGALKNTDYKVDDYPMLKTSGEYEVAQLPTFEISQRVNQILPFVGNDDLRPVVNGICLKFGTHLDTNVSKVIATNMHILGMAYLHSGYVHESDKTYLVDEPKYLSYFLNSVKDESVKIFGCKEANRLKFSSDDIVLSLKLIDATPPNYESVVDTNINTIMELDAEALLHALNSLKGEDLKYDVYFDFDGSERDRGYFNLKLSQYVYNSGTKVTKDLNIKIACKFTPKSENDFIKSMALIMPVSTGNENFAFNIKYLKTILSVSDGRFYFDDRKPSPQFIVKLDYVEPRQEPTKKVVQMVKPPTPSKEDIQATIDALRFIADSGNKDAKDTIESLMFLI